MGVYIEDMKMPKSCEECPLCYDYLHCIVNDDLGMCLYNRHPNCPLIEIDLVRCKECKHRKKNGFCLEHNRYEKNDKGYCSYGERRADEN